LIVVIIAPNKVTKGAPKHGEKVNLTDTRPKIVVETVNSPDVSVEEALFDAIEAPQAAGSAATTATAPVDCEDDEVSVCFNPPHIRTRAETTAERFFVKRQAQWGLKQPHQICMGWTDRVRYQSWYYSWARLGPF
jgi:hypothetical protein